MPSQHKANYLTKKRTMCVCVCVSLSTPILVERLGVVALPASIEYLHQLERHRQLQLGVAGLLRLIVRRLCGIPAHSVKQRRQSHARIRQRQPLRTHGRQRQLLHAHSRLWWPRHTCSRQRRLRVGGSVVRSVELTGAPCCSTPAIWPESGRARIYGSNG